MDPFDTLGLPARYDLDLKQIEARYRDLQRALHPDKHAQAPASGRRASLSRSVDVNDAYRILRDDLQRAAALIARLGGKPSATGQPQDPELLMEVMELREALAEAKLERDLHKTRVLSEQVAELEARARAALREAFSMLDEAKNPQALSAAESALSRLKYYRRFQDEVASIEEDALG